MVSLTNRLHQKHHQRRRRRKVWRNPLEANKGSSRWLPLKKWEVQGKVRAGPGLASTWAWSPGLSRRVGVWFTPYTRRVSESCDCPGLARQLSCHLVQLINQLSIITWLSFSNLFNMLLFLKTKDLCFIEPCSSPEAPLQSARVLIVQLENISWLACFSLLHFSNGNETTQAF